MVCSRVLLGALSAAALASSTPILAQGSANDIALRCGSPKGWRASYGSLFDLLGKPLYTAEQGIRWTEDYYSNASLLLVMTASSPNVLLISWRGTTGSEQFISANVVHRDKAQIQAIEKGCGPLGCTLYLYSVFPTPGLVTILRTGRSGGLNAKDDESRSSLYAAQCVPIN